MPGLLADIGHVFAPVFRELASGSREDAAGEQQTAEQGGGAREGRGVGGGVADDAAFIPEGAGLAHVADVAGAPADVEAVGLRPSQRADFQVDGALALARKLGRAPREVAEEVLDRAKANGLDKICEVAEVAGPGFINLGLSGAFLALKLQAMALDGEGLGIQAPRRPLRVVVDYGAPNAAKQMHVGHLRSTIIGDAIVRQLEFAGHEVVRENHVGDWGAPFGMLIEHLNELGATAAAEELAVGDLEAFYQAARARYDGDGEFAQRARARVVELQSGDPGAMKLWQQLVSRSLAHFDQSFELLGSKLTRDDVVGESFYKPMLPEVVADLDREGLLVESDGALCVFPPGHANREGAPLPLIVRNSAGGYTYAATDLAAVKDRTQRIGAQLLLYVVGAPQAQHFHLVFDTARLMGWLGPSKHAVHVAFGNVLGPDGKMFRTRQGGTVKLSELLDEAVRRARALVEARAERTGADAGPHPEKSGGTGGTGTAQVGTGPVGTGQAGTDQGRIGEIARAVGIGAVKYADLSTDRTRDYRFDWDRMLSLDGNTAPYIQYAHARTRSLLRRAGNESATAAGFGEDGREQMAAALGLPPAGAEERELAKRLLGFPDALASALETYSPHKLCGYLFELAGAFTTFYESSPVLKAPSAELRAARLALCALTGDVLRRGLELLGIGAPERM